MQVFFSLSCNKAGDLPVDPVPEPLQETDVIFLGHKGSGSTNYSSSFIENTMPSVIEGLKTMNGVEVDMQMSLDGTLWMFHDPSTGRESSDSLDVSLILLRDSAITRLERRSGTKKDRIYRLSELMNHWNASASGYYISIEAKSDFPEDTFRAAGGRQPYLILLADNFTKLLSTMKHPGKLFLEAEDQYFCDRVKANNNGKLVAICKMNYIHFDQQITEALAQGFNGISCWFDDTTATSERVKKAQDSGLFVQMWTPNELSELSAAFKKHPNVIQTDNMSAKALLKLK